MYDNIVLNIPHSSVEGIAGSGWPQEKSFFTEIRKWTDWYTDHLFWSDTKAVTPVRFDLSRFVVDVERLENDPLESIGQGIVYHSFNGHKRILNDLVRQELMARYHDHINRLKSCLTPRSILVDCHSFPSEYSDVEVCIGFNQDWSKPSEQVIDNVVEMFRNAGYRVALNIPYSNALSPRCEFDYHSLMIEVNKSTYMDENTLELTEDATRIKNVIADVYDALLNK